MQVRTRKRYGQHFLQDKTVTSKIINAIDVDPSMEFVEIGPGRGALTIPLLDIMDRLHVVEIDSDLVAYLKGITTASEKLVIHNIDALELDFCKIIGSRLFIIGNLPYNISTPLLFHLIDHIQCIQQMIFMLQKEVAERICATPGSKDYGRLSVMVQSMCKTNLLFDVGPEAFYPKPRVVSSLIRLTPLFEDVNKPDSIETFKHIVRAAFNKRRKTMRNALKGIASEEILISSGLDPDQRPETVDVDTYIRLSNKLYNFGKATSH